MNMIWRMSLPAEDVWIIARENGIEKAYLTPWVPAEAEGGRL